jgi:hypothetical protein
MNRSKKKHIRAVLNRKHLADRKLTIIKILPKDGTISQDDLDRWHEIFRTNSTTPELAEATGEVKVQVLHSPKEEEHFITLVKVGSDDHHPTVEELEQWREVFEAAAKDPDFKIFTHHMVDVSVIPLNKVVAVE